MDRNHSALHFGTDTSAMSGSASDTDPVSAVCCMAGGAQSEGKRKLAAASDPSVF